MIKKLIIFGAGVRGIRLYTVLRKMNEALLGEERKEILFCDNNSLKWGGQIEGKRVISPDELNKYDKTGCVIFIASHFYQDIYKQVKSMGFEKVYYLYHETESDIFACDDNILNNPGATAIIAYIDSNKYLELKRRGVTTYTELFADRVKRAKVFVDVGAEWGYYSYLAYKNMSSDSQIYAVEPIPYNMQVLRNTYGKIPNIHFLEYAVSDNDSGMVLYSEVGRSYGAINNPYYAKTYGEDSFVKHAFTMDRDMTKFPREGEVIDVNVKTATMDSLFENVEIDIVKMDIEGAEVFALEGMRNILKKGRTRIFLDMHADYIENLKKGGVEQIARLMEEYNYVCYSCSGLYLKESDIRQGKAFYLVPVGLKP